MDRRVRAVCGGLLVLTTTLALAGCADGGTVPRPTDGGLPGTRDDASLRDADVRSDASQGDGSIAVVDCPPPPSCDAPLPDLGETEDWRHSVSTPWTTSMGSPRHRGRDLVLRASDPQWALAKFAYGWSDDDLKDEDVDLYLLRGCAGEWEPLGTATTTEEGEHATVEGVEDTGGRVYFEIPASARLGVGRHRILFVVRGDHSFADQFVEVLPDDARFVVTDVDGTQTESETAEWRALFGSSGPEPRPYGPELLWAFSRRGYHIFYLTARPDWLHTRTHRWLGEYGYPPGVVHTTLGGTGATGSAAETFKTGELEAILARFPGAIEVAIGNTDTDTAAYANVGIPPERAFLYQYDPGAAGTRVDDYSTLIPFAESLAPLCL